MSDAHNRLPAKADFPSSYLDVVSTDIVPSEADAVNHAALYDQLDGLVSEHGYTPHAREEVVVAKGGRFKRPRVEERLVPTPIDLQNGLEVEERAVFEPNPTTVGYRAGDYGYGTIPDPRFSMVGEVFPYQGTIAANAFYGAPRGNGTWRAAMVVDRLGNRQDGRKLLAVSTGFVNEEGYGFRPVRSLLIERLGRAAMRTYPTPGLSETTYDVAVPPEGVARVRRDINTLLDPEIPDMRPCPPKFDSVPDISVVADPTQNPYSNRFDNSRTWVQLKQAT